MTAKAQTSPSAALEQLQSWLADGTLAETIKRHQLGSELDEVRALLRSGAQQLEKVRKLGHAAGLVGKVTPDALRTVQVQSDRLGAAGHLLRKADTPDSLRDWRRVHWDRIKDAVDELTHVLGAAWRETCEAPFGEHERLGDVLTRFSETKALGLEMKETSRAGKTLGKIFPPTPQSRAEFDKAVQRAAEERKRVGDLGLNDEIAALLLAAADNRATLADLTPPALEWLRANGALALFQLRLASPPMR